MNSIKDDKKRVLVFSLAYVPFVGGAELAVKEITDRIGDFNFDLITLRFNRNWAKQEKIGNANVYRIGGGKLLFPFFAFCKACSLNRKRKYDLVWSVMANRAGFASLFFKLWNPKTKYLLTLQEGDALNYPEKRMGVLKIVLTPFFRKIFTKADFVQAISNYLADWAKKMGAKTEKIEVVPNGVDVNKLKIKNEKLKTDRKIIITTSRLVYKNGVDVLIKAMSRLELGELWILGSSGPDEKKLKDLVKELSIESRVKFFDHIEPEKIPEYLARADIFVRPSRTEGLGSSFLEAMGAGLPTIGTRAGGIPDFLKDGETGLFCEIDNPQDLAEKIKLLMRDESLAKKIAENGKKLVLEKYDWDKIAQKMFKIFTDVQPATLNVLICSGVYPPDVGGPAKYAKNLKEDFLSMGNGVRVLAYGLEKKLPIGARHIWYFFRAVFALSKTDLIIGLDIFSTGFPAVLAGKIFRKKIILRVGGDFLWETYTESTGNLIKIKDFYANRPRLSLKFKIIAFLQRFALKNASALAFNSSWQKDFFEKIYNLNPDKNFIIENFYPQKTESSEKENKSNEPVFLFAGRKIKFKNLKLLEEVFDEFVSEGIKAKLEIVDNLSQEKLREKIKNSYALITVSISDFAPNFIIEGLSCNKPFILTKECGLVEKLGELGIFVDSLDKNDIKRGVLSLMDTNNYNKYKEKISAFNFSHSWNEIAKEFLAIGKIL